jgi:hypothetical protein
MSNSARWIAGILVGVLSVTVIVLAYFAIERTRGVDTAGNSGPLRTPTPLVTGSPTPTPTPSSDAPVTPVATAPGPAERFLSIGSGAMWRATAGACGVTAPVLERSTDAGKTWVDVTPTYLGIGQILGVDAFAGSEAEIVALVGSGCELQALRTFTQGEFWEPNDDALAAATYIEPGNAASVKTPGATVAAPCATAWGVRANGATTALICDGTAYRLGGDGQWQPQVSGVLAVEATDAGVRSVLGATDTCGGLSIAGSACIEDSSPDGPAAVASSSGGRTFVWSADTWTSVPTP